MSNAYPGVSAQESVPCEATLSVPDLLADQRQHWQRGERILVEAYLKRYPALAVKADDVLDLIGNEWLLRQERNERPTADEYLARFPDWTAHLRRQFEVERALDSEILGEGTLTQYPVATPIVSSRTTAPQLIPGYEVLGALGRGGQSVVYKARHVALNRLVALKMIMAGAAAAPEERERFRREAEAVAHLKHPHIVEIYDLGEHADQPFFALEFVGGGTLAKKIAGVPQPPQQAAGILETLARTMHWAHRQGIVHRDLKPANVLLTADGTLKIADFGLAKRLEGDSSLTQTGYIMGTPSYMAPEQAAGKTREVGPAADVYALGAILYEMLTGRPPFLGQSSWDILPQVLSSEPVPPGRLQPKVPRDLETICLKCLEKDPAKRYLTAEILADDLRRFDHGEPILARPVSMASRLWRWARRSPKVAGLLGALLVVILVSLAGMTTLWLRAEQQRGQAEASFQDAFDTVGNYLTTISEERLLNEPGLQALRKELLLKAQRYYEKFVQERGQDPAVQAALAMAYHRLGLIELQIGEQSRALEYLDKESLIWQKLVADFPEEIGHRIDLAGVYNAQAGIAITLNRITRAEELYQAALTLLQDQHVDDPSAIADLKRIQIAAYNDLGVLHGRLTGKLELAAAAYGKALTLQEQLLKSDPDNRDHNSFKAVLFQGLSTVRTSMGRGNEAVALCEKAREIQEELVRRYPDVVKFNLLLSSTYHSLGFNYTATGQRESAEKFYLKGVELLKKLHQQNPLVTEYQVTLVERYRGLSYLYGSSDQSAKAEAICHEALQVVEKLVANHSLVPRFRDLLAECHHDLAFLYDRLDQKSKALAAFDKTLTLRTRLAEDHPAVPTYQSGLALAYENVGWANYMSGNTEAAETAYKKGIVILEKLTRDFPDNNSFQSGLASIVNDLGVLYAKLGKASLAEDAYRQAIALHERLVPENPRVVEYQAKLARHWNNLGNVWSDTGRLPDALAAYQKSLRFREDVVRNCPDVPRYQCDLAACNTSLGIWHRNHGQLGEAEKEFQKAVVLWEKLIPAFPQIAGYQQSLGDSYFNLGLVQQSTDRRSLAEESFNKALAVYAKLIQDQPEVPMYRQAQARALSALAGLTQDRDLAEKTYHKALGVIEIVVKNHPRVPDYVLDIAQIHNNRALGFQSDGRSTEAEDCFRQALSFYERLVEDYPGVVVYQTELAMSYSNLGHLVLDKDNLTAAEASYKKALAIREKLAEAHSSNLAIQWSLQESCYNLGFLTNKADKPQEAFQWYSRSIAILQAILEHNPEHADAEYWVSLAHWGRALACESLGRHADALKDWERALEFDQGANRAQFLLRVALAFTFLGEHHGPAGEADNLSRAKDNQSETLYDLARIYARASTNVMTDERLSQADREKLAESYAVRSIEMLARTGNYFKNPANRDALRNNSDFDPLRDHEDFKNLLRELEGPATPKPGQRPAEIPKGNLQTLAPFSSDP